MIVGNMAVDVCSEISSLVASPRISFSYDLNQTDVVPIECFHRRSDALLVDFTTDFDFGITTKSFVQEISSADELFSNGKILPTQIKKHKTTKKEIHRSEPILVHPQPSKTTTTALHWENTNDQDTKKKRLKEFLFESSEEEEEEEEVEEEKPASKSFWQFKRSASLNCDNGRSKGLIRSLQILARSNSTGSAPNSKQTRLPKVTPPKKHSQKQSTFTCSNQQPVLPFSGYNNQFYNSSGRPPSLKNCRSYSSGVRIINPILNIPPSYISKGTANLFGFGSFFCNGKSKKKKK